MKGNFLILTILQILKILLQNDLILKILLNFATA